MHPSERPYRFSITARLFWVILAVCITMLISMGVAMRVSFDTGFLDYLDEQERDRLTALGDLLQDEYSQQGNWQFLQTDPKVWRKLVSRHIRQDAPRPKKQSDVSEAERARRSWQAAQLRSSLGLMAADKKELVAGVAPGANAIWQPVGDENGTVGWLTRDPLTGVTDNIDLRFQEQQMTAGWIIAGLSLALAAVVSVFLARSFVAPVQRIARATNRLALGDLSARVSIATNDELRLLSEHLNLLAETLQKNESSRRTFMAEISHELRTPLAILRGEIEALEDGLRPLTRESLASLRAEVGILTRLVDDIHALSLADLGVLAYEKAEINIANTLDTALRAFTDRSRHLCLERDLCAEPLPVFADEGRISQVLRNVLENSLRYTDEGGVVRVYSRVEGEHVIIDVQDSPPGVPEEQLGQMFERFRTGDAARNRKTSGSGLGLAICRSIMQAHAGSILAHPSPLGGVWMSISMPLSTQGAPSGLLAESPPCHTAEVSPEIQE